MQFYLKETDAVFDEVKSSQTGLTAEEAAKRLEQNGKNKLAEAETQKVLDSMTYSKNPKSMLVQPKKSLDEMTSQEIDELLEKYI